MQADLDGPLVDYVAKGTRIELEGTEQVEGRDAYRLKLTMSNSQVTHVWIDSQTFLERKIEGQPRRLDGVQHSVEVYFSDYREVSGLQVPFLLETRVLPLPGQPGPLGRPFLQSEKTILEKVSVNPKLDEAVFTRPGIELASNAK